MDTDGFQFANPIDNLTYLYDTDNKNQLLRVFDATANPGGFKDDTDGTDINIDINEDPDYKYDLNGNMTTDSNKGILEITYNHLNLPTEIVFSNGKINYLYNAVGQKVSKKVTQGSLITNTDYLSGFQYKNNFLQFFPHAEGYVNATQNGIGYTFHYVFNFTDHLGNIRLSYSQDPATNVLKIIEENHYYPFGLKHSGYNSDRMMYVKEGSFLKIKPAPPLFVTSYDYKYNGKEYQDELGLNMYDYGARNYDPALGRWMNIDPLAENSRRWTPYNYAYNNPIYFVDPDGMQAERAIDLEKEAEIRKSTEEWLANRDNDDITIRGKNVQTGEMEPALVVKTDAIDISIDIESLPLLTTHDPITNKPNSFNPIVVEGVDAQLQLLKMTLGQADGLTISFAGGVAAGGGLSGGFNVTSIFTGKDAGGVFLYSTDAPSPTVGLAAGGGIEIGAVYSAPSTSNNFSRYSLEGYSVNLAGGYGPLTGTVSMGVEGMFDWTPTSFTGTIGAGYSSFKVGGTGSVTNTVLQQVIRNPKK